MKLSCGEPLVASQRDPEQAGTPGSRRTILELAFAMADHIEHFYNSERRHSSLGYFTPDEFEERHSTATQ